MQAIDSDPRVSKFLPPNIRQALVDTQGWSRDLRRVRIDTLTLEAHRQYPELVRHPEDVSRLGEWAAIRWGRSGPDQMPRIIDESE